MRLRVIAAALLVTACTGASTPKTADPSPAPAFFDPCPTASADHASGGLPDLTLPCLGKGSKVNLASLRGPLLLNVWGSWCGPCQAEAPELQKFYAAAKGRVGLLGIDYGDTRGSAQDFAGHIGMTYPSVFDGDDEIRGRGPFVISGLPMTVFVRADGTVAHVGRGAFTSQADIAKQVATYLGVQV